LLSQCSAVFFDNRLLMTASPFIMSEDGNIGFKDLAALDFAPVSSMQGKSAPAWCGEWDGVRFVKLACGSFRGEERCFAVVRNAGGGNELWEILKTGAAETASGDRLPGGAGSAVAALVETPARDFGDAKRRKRLERVEVEVSGVAGPLELRAWWRCDAGGRWNLLDEVATVAPVSDPEGAGAAPHVWRNLSAQGRSQWRTYSVPERVDVIYRRGAQIGFNFQLRISWRGICKIERVRMRAALIDDGDFAERETWAGGARLDLTGNELHYTAGETI
jgi:hypothetical protein